MNRYRFRLVLHRESNRLVPVAESTHVRRKADVARRGARSARALLAAALLPLAALAGRDLPVYVPGTGFVTRGAAQAPVVAGNVMTIKQTTTAPTVLNWRSFDVGAAHRVHFDQPSSLARVLNVVQPGGPRSEIFGAISAPGQVFIFNQAGILIGSGAQINVGGLVASALSIDDQLIERTLSALGTSAPAFGLAPGAPSAAEIEIQAGARIVASSNGRVLLAAPHIRNAGEIVVPEGQIIAAAGQKVYLADPLDARLRGFLVEVDAGGALTNEATGRLLAERGNIALAGLNLRQNGTARSTTSVNLNGSIFLQARDTVVPQAVVQPSGEVVLIPRATRGGTLTVGAGSLTEVAPDASAASVRDDVSFTASQIELSARRVVVEDAPAGGPGAVLRAHGGSIGLSAQAGQEFSLTGVPDAQARIYLGRGAVLDVSGLRDVAVPVARNVVQVELRGDELKDSPVQRDPAFGRVLYGEKVWVDLRQGTPLANVEGYRAGVERTVQEKSSAGGSITLRSEGDVLVAGGSLIDVSGGSIAYSGGRVPYTMLQTTEGRILDMASALPELTYRGKLDATRVEAGYLEGRDAGSVRVQGYRVALDGDLRGGRVLGPLQRQPGTQPGARLPHAGQLVVGAASQANVADAIFQTPDILIARAAPARTLTADGAAPEQLVLSAAIFDRGGFGRAELYSQGAVQLAADTALDLGAGGSFTATAREIGLDGALVAPGGSVTLATRSVAGDPTLDPGAHDIVLGGGALVSVAGAWVNDLPLAGGRGTGPVAIRGGSVVLDANSDIGLSAGSRIDVSGGAWVGNAGDATPGAAGSVRLRTGRLGITSTERQTSRLVLDGELAGYGAAFGAATAPGGSLTLDTSTILIGPGATAPATRGSELALSSRFFELGGFREFALRSADGVIVTDGAVVQPRPLSRVFDPRAYSRPSGGALATFSDAVVLPSELRNGTVVRLGSRSALFGEVTVEQGARVEVDPTGAITIDAERQLTVAGTLRAPAGSIVLAMTPPTADDRYEADRSLFIAGSATLDAAGAYRPERSGVFRLGEVLPGGRIDLSSARGYLIAQDGAVLDVRGTAATLDLVVSATGARAPRSIASAGGEILLAARDGLYVDADLLAAGAPGAAGGSFRAALLLGSPWFLAAGDPGVVNDPRRLLLSQDDSAGTAGLAAGAPLDTLARAGRAAIAADLLAAGGFADVRLRSEQRIEFTESVRFQAAQRLSLDAPNLTAAPAANITVDLAAAVVSLANLDPSRQYVFNQDLAQTGAGSLTLQARLLEVIGNLAVSGFGRVTLDSSGDLRLTGIDHDVDPSPTSDPDYRLRGSLVTAGDLTLRARQVYPTSQSEFALEIHNNPAGTVRVEANGSAQPVLSAGGRLAVSAPHIVQAGVIKAPLGEIVLSADLLARTDRERPAVRSLAPQGSVVLEPGSVTSVSAEDLLIPFGKTELSGRDYVYALGTGPLSYRVPSQKSVILRADALDVRAGAKVDLSGGGDTLAWEFTPGPGGSRDILDPLNAPDSFAILPGQAGEFAAYDFQSYAGVDLQPGRSLEILAPAAGLQPGVYALLPARYALLPGAYLVTLRPELADLPAGQTLRQTDGTSVVAARTATVQLDGSLVRSARTLGAQILTPDQVGLRAEFSQVAASAFFASLPNVQLPGDAGRLALQAGSSLALDGALETAGQPQRRSAQVDITAERLALLGEGQSAQTGEVGIQVAALNRLAAESLLIGGVRRATPDGVDIATGRDDFGALTVALRNGPDEPLAAPEVLLVGRESVSLAQDSALAATGAADGRSKTWRLQGDGALLRAASGADDQVVRVAPQFAAGVLELDTGAQVRARSVILDATLRTASKGDIVLPPQGGVLTVSAGRISAGETQGVTEGLIFSNQQIAALGNPQSLRLKSYTTLDLYGDVVLGGSALGDLVIDAAGIGGYRNSGGDAQLVAQRVVLVNPDASAFVPAPGQPAGGGSLAIVADEVVLGGTGSDATAPGGTGRFEARGFATNVITAKSQLLATEAGEHRFSGELTLNTGRIAADPGSDRRLRAEGAVTILAAVPPDPVLGAAPLGAAPLGGKLVVEGRAIDMAGVIDLPAGRVSLRALGPDAGDGVLLRPTARIDAAGVVRTIGGIDIAAPGGVIELSSVAGSVIVDGALLDVSGAAAGDRPGAGAADAGRIAVSAPRGVALLAGSLRGAARDGARGGEFALDVGTLDSFAEFNQASAAFTGARALRVRAGDIVVGAGELLRALEISLAADAGDLRVGDGAIIDASGAKGGRIGLYARPGAAGGGDLTLESGATLSARATEAVGAPSGTAGRGGSVFLEATAGDDGGSGRLSVLAGSSIDVSAAEGSAAPGGTIVLRAARTAGALNVAPVAGALRGASEVFAEGTVVVNASVLDMAAAHADNTAFMANAPAIRERLLFPAAGAGETVYRLRPHTEFRAAGDFAVAADTSLAGHRYDVEAGTLTVRAAGNLNLNGSLSDGFSTAEPTGVLNSGADAWSYRLVSGADASAADPGAVRALAALESADSGDFRLANGKLVRTGRGDIEIVSGRDLRLGSDASVIYTAGVADARGAPFEAATNITVGSHSRRADYPTDGGDVRVAAQRDIDAAPSAQLINDWLYRQGRLNANGTLLTATIVSNRRNPTWWPRFDLFRQGVATFGGGDVVVRAGGDIANLGASAATNGRLFGDPNTLPDPANLKVQGGGDVVVRAAGDIDSGVFYAGRGQMTLRAGGEIGSSRSSAAGDPVHSVLALGESSASVVAARGIALETVLNPTLAQQVGAYKNAGNRIAFFSTYGARAAVELSSLAGDVQLLNGSGGGVSALPFAFGTEATFYPAQVRAVAMNGSIRIGGSMTLAPDAGGRLTLLAADSVHIGGTIKMPDTAPRLTPAPLRPITDLSAPVWRDIVTANLEGARAHDAQLLDTRDREPIRIVALTGDIAGEHPTDALVAPKAVILEAGRDIVDAGVRTQNLVASDVTRIEAGRDVRFSTEPDPSGNLEVNDSGFVVGGPGRVELIAGRSIDLGNSTGVLTRGNFNNPYLPEGGASLYVQATTATTDYAALLAFLRAPAAAPIRAAEGIADALARVDAAIVAYTRARLDLPGLPADAARAAFEALDPATRAGFYRSSRPLLNDLVVRGIRYAGRRGDRLQQGREGYQPGYDLIDALFPVQGGGSVDLFYSQLRTEQGVFGADAGTGRDSGIVLFAPFGGVNVGLANPGAFQKAAAEQGIFAADEGAFNALVGGDFLVNQSRVFTLGGGDIQIWSSTGDIDAGRGAKTAASTPPPLVRVRGDIIVLDISASVSGSGIGSLRGRDSAKDGDVRLYAPAGAVDAGDAGIRSTGAVEISAQRVIGAGNIQAGGSVSGVAAPSAAGPPAAGASSAAAATQAQPQQTTRLADPIAQTDSPLASFITVDVIGLGDEADEEERRRRAR